MDVPIDQLQPFPDHARCHPAAQIRTLARSIETFGFNTPIVIDDRNHILAGHARVEAARRLGLDTVPAVRVTDLTEAEKRAFVLADNRLTESAAWDETLLAQNFQILDALDLDFPLEVTGFETSEIDRLLGFEIVDETAREEETIEISIDPPVSRAGDIWRLGEHTVLCGDARDTAANTILMGEDRARMVLTDPPYNVSARHIGRTAAARHGDFIAAAGELNDADFVAFLADAFACMRAASCDGALAFVFIDWRHAWHALEAGRSVFDELKNIVVWNKSNGGMGSFYRSKHEIIAVFKAGTKPHTNNIDLGRHGRYRTNVWDYAGVNTFREGRQEELAMHPTVKPVALVADAIKDCTRRNDIVLDPFVGSGTTILAAEKTGRRAYAMELDPRYVDVAVERWQDYTGEAAVHGETGRTFEQMRAERLGAGASRDAARRKARRSRR
ncbi:MAG: site-specific DNA-methyltransferase [Alphaproteobacteria bacterium]|nr:site-specific DNA-methyltransferase [Alphaproteobacteria bacterium]